MNTQESFAFQAEVVQILDLMVHSLYSNKEIFLRELISNASDAIDRLRLELLAQSELPEAEGPLQIRVSYDSGARTITVDPKTHTAYVFTPEYGPAPAPAPGSPPPTGRGRGPRGPMIGAWLFAIKH